AGLDAPAARAQVIGRHGELMGTAGLLRLGEGLTLQGEVFVPLSEPTSYRIDLEVGRQRVARQTVRLVPPRRWTLYWLSSNHTDIGYTDLQDRCLEIHRENLDAAVKRLATRPNPERALPLLPPDQAGENRLAGSDWTAYPQLYWWEGPDGSRVLHCRNYRYGDASRFGFDTGADEMGRRLSDWLLGNPVFQSPEWPYDIALLYGASLWDNSLADERMVANLDAYGRRYQFPRIVPGRAEDFFREVERRWGPKLPVRRGDTGLYWEDGAASTAAELAWFRRAQLAARATGLLALWDDRVESEDEGKAGRIAARATERRAMWRELLLFGEHTWGADVSVTDPDARQTVAQWAYKRRF